MKNPLIAGLLCVAQAVTACASDSDSATTSVAPDDLSDVTGFDDTASASDTPVADTAPLPDSAPPPAEPAWMTWSVAPPRAVYRPDQTVTLVVEVLGDDGQPMSDVPLSLRTDGPDDAVEFDASTMKLTFVREARLTLTLCVDDTTLCSASQVWVDAGPPQLLIERPTAGAEVGGEGAGAPLQVSGTVKDALPVTVFVNSMPATLDGETFSAELQPDFGVNHLVVAAVDQLGHETVVEHDVLWAPAYGTNVAADAAAAPTMTLASGMALRLDQGFFDDRAPIDDKATPIVAPDLAGILELVFRTMNLNDFLPGDLGGGTGLSLSNARIIDSEVTIDLTDEGMALFVSLDPVRVNTAGSLDVGDTTINLAGTADVVLAAFAEVETRKEGADAAVDVQMTDLTVLVERLTTNLDDANADALFTLASSGIRSALEEAAHGALDDALRQTLPQLMSEALGSIDMALHNISVPLSEPFAELVLTMDGRLGVLRPSALDGLAGSLTVITHVGDARLHPSRGVALTGLHLAAGEVSAGRCGDAVIDAGEQCDDGARVAGDGCDVACRAEPGFVCDDAGCLAACTGGSAITRDETTYRYCNKRVVWDAAAAFCEQAGGTLAIVESAEENAILGELPSNSVRWLGASDADTPGTWRWVDGQVFWESDAAVPGHFEAWEQGAFDDPEAHCAGVTSDGGWSAFGCGSKRRFLCEQPASCGDGVLGDGEVCDDGNEDDLDGCTRDCQTSAFGFAPVEVAVQLSFVNALLHQLWSAGLLEIEGASFLGPQFAGLVERAMVHGRLPPLVRQGRAWEDTELALSIGQMEMELELAGQRTTYGIRLDAGLAVNMVDNGVNVDIAEVPEIRTWIIDSANADPLIDSAALRQLLLDRVWPDMRAALQAVLNLELPLPSIDLDAIQPGLGVLQMTLAPTEPPAIGSDAITLRAALEAQLLLLQ